MSSPVSHQKSLSEALAEFDRQEAATRLPERIAEIGKVVADFPLDEWPTMPLERYALGTVGSTDSFCYRMEFGTPVLCSMKGGSARKHIIFQRKSDQTWHHDASFNDEQAAWEKARKGFVQAFVAADEGRLTDVDTIEALRSGPALTAKAISCYVPGAILPITSRDHVRHFIAHLSGDAPPSLEPFAAHERLKQLVDADERFKDWHPYEVMDFLYWWADPRSGVNILKISPGDRGMYWEECLAGNYICIGWDDVGDLTAFASEDDFRSVFDAKYSAEYKGHKSKMSAKANELWRRFYQLQPGDIVVANRGTKEVLGIGTVNETGYSWRPEREQYRHTMAVDWDTSFAQKLDPPQNSWGTVTVAKVSSTLWKTLQAGAGTKSNRGAEIAARAASVPTDLPFEQLAALLDGKGQAVLYGPPGTGKTYTSLRFALWWLATRLPELDLDPLANYDSDDFRQHLGRLSTGAANGKLGHLTQVTFHPAYGYEDFIEGFRPVQSTDGGLRLALQDGIFTKVCTAAAADRDRPYLILIDEINRGDIPKILGELITLLERDKRDVAVTLPSGRRFTVPPNVHLLGTMNTADRSIRLLDSALRRRFAFHELLPNSEMLHGAKVGNLDLGLALDTLNQRVVKELGRERQIGQSFFLSRGVAIDSESDLATAFRTEILPLLQEYAYDDYSMLARFLSETIVDVQKHTVADLSDEELVEALYTALEVDAGEQ